MYISLSAHEPSQILYTFISILQPRNQLAFNFCPAYRELEQLPHTYNVTRLRHVSERGITSEELRFDTQSNILETTLEEKEELKLPSHLNYK